MKSLKNFLIGGGAVALRFCKLSSMLLAAGVAFAPASASAALITGVTCAETSSGFPLTYPIGWRTGNDTVDGHGGVPTNSYTGNQNINEIYCWENWGFSDPDSIATGGNGSTTYGTTLGHITWDLGATYTVDRFHFWNYVMAYGPCR